MCLLMLLACFVLAGCASLPTDYTRIPSMALSDTQGTLLGQRTGLLLAAQPGMSGVLPLQRGTDAFLARLALAEAAEKSLDIQYYIWHADTTGKVLAESILRAAQRGVRVRLLLDDIGTAADDRTLLAIDSQANIEVRLFNPIAARSTKLLGLLADFSRANRRMHNKSFTADSQVMIVGGRNIGDEYFGARQDVEFADLDLLAIGPVVGDVSRQFDHYWNSPLAYPITALSRDSPGQEATQQALAGLRAFVEAQREGRYAQALQDSGLAEGLASGSLPFSYAPARVMADDPLKLLGQAADEAPHLLRALLPEFEALRKELVLVSAYFVPGDTGVANLRGLVRRGVRVRVLTNSLASTDVPAAYAGYQRYRRALLEAGVELHELKAKPPLEARGQDAAGGQARRGRPLLSGSSRASLHAKTLVFDRNTLFISSMNMDPRSVFTNTEIGVLVSHPGLAAAQVERLDSRLAEISYRLELVPAAGGEGATDIVWVTTQDGRTTRYTSPPKATVWQRFKVWFYSLLPIEHLL